MSTSKHAAEESDEGPIRVQNELSKLPPEVFEQRYVHSVYNDIAGHFSDTRYKPWPAVESFLNGQLPGSIGVDVGCGNGKYLGVNKENVMNIGCDRSDELVRICRQRGHEAFVADGLSVPIRSRSMDFAISIAVVHHFATPERRLAAVQECLRVVKDDGTVFIQVWALEQQGKRSFSEQDNFVSWSLPASKYRPQSAEGSGTNEAPGGRNLTFQRFYHLFAKGELDELVEACGGRILESGYEKDNHYVVCRPALQ
ncbi:S-adenosyl-L-methionine-dependent methyltransferase [Hyaloraphidium curvatum]|nr:S-adenosyl-L-methionine-dependent methyltransferase [Hyaloraphidium curvatum]